MGSVVDFRLKPKPRDILQNIVDKVSGTGTNFKVGGGHASGTKRRNIFCRAPLLFFGSTSAISRFRDGQ